MDNNKHSSFFLEFSIWTKHNLMLKQNQRHMIKCLYLYDEWVSIIHTQLTYTCAMESYKLRNAVPVKGDVSVCIVPANVIYLFIYFLFLKRERERGGKQLGMSHCRTMLDSELPHDSACQLGTVSVRFGTLSALQRELLTCILCV